jgi:hypothetical protein
MQLKTLQIWLLKICKQISHYALTFNIDYRAEFRLTGHQLDCYIQKVCSMISGWKSWQRCYMYTAHDMILYHRCFYAPSTNCRTSVAHLKIPVTESRRVCETRQNMHIMIIWCNVKLILVCELWTFEQFRCRRSNLRRLSTKAKGACLNLPVQKRDFSWLFHG